MNNVHYIQWSVENSPGALELLGVAWLERHKVCGWETGLNRSNTQIGTLTGLCGHPRVM